MEASIICLLPDFWVKEIWGFQHTLTAAIVCVESPGCDWLSLLGWQSFHCRFLQPYAVLLRWFSLACDVPLDGVLTSSQYSLFVLATNNSWIVVTVCGHATSGRTCPLPLLLLGIFWWQWHHMPLSCQCDLVLLVGGAPFCLTSDIKSTEFCFCHWQHFMFENLHCVMDATNVWGEGDISGHEKFSLLCCMPMAHLGMRHCCALPKSCCCHVASW